MLLWQPSWIVKMTDGAMPAFRVEDAFSWPADPTAMIWRYMAFEHFVWMLENRAVRFCSVAKFDDPFEGSLTELEDEEFSAAYDTTVRKATRMHTVKFSRYRVMASCWHFRSYECAFMWNHYANTGKGIAVQSTFNRLERAVSGVAAGVGLVDYIDQKSGRTHTHPFYGPYMHKRRWLEAEREVRALLYYKGESIPDGLPVAVDIDKLITGIVVRKKPEALINHVREVVSAHGLGARVSTSEIDGAPIF
jgi:hypothetical protein